MMLKLFVILLLLSAELISFANSIKYGNKQELILLCETISSNKVIPNEMANRFASYLNSKESQANALPLLGMLLGIVFAPVIAPLFAAPGLFGAAAVSNGLATIGGGSLLAGGAGMLGGQIVIGLSGATLGSLVSYASYKNSYAEFMKTQPSRFYDSVTWGDYEIRGYFKYTGDTLLDGPTKIYKQNTLVFDDYVHCDSTLKCELLYDY